MRILIITGKGGVGKTSMAAATGAKCAELGKKTLVMSTDAAHSLSDSFDIPLGAEPKKVAPNLYGHEVDVNKELCRYWKNIQNFIRNTLQSRGIDNVIADEISVFPGMEEFFSLLTIKELYRAKEYDVLIIDCAPTASTIRKLSFPEIGKWYLKNIFPIHRNVAKVARPIAKGVYGVDLPTEEMFSDIKTMIEALDGIKEILTDEKTTSVRFVLNPEKMVIKEAQRAYTYMNLFGYGVDSVFVNRVYPEKISDAYFDKWKVIQEKHLKSITESFSPLKQFRVELFDEEIVGIEKLRFLGNHIFGDLDPTANFTSGRPIELSELKDGKACLSIKIPYVDKNDLHMWVRGDELTVKTPLYKRKIMLPRVLTSMSLKGAKFEEEKLRVSFEGETN